MNKFVSLLDTHYRLIRELANAHCVSSQTVITALLMVALKGPDLRIHLDEVIKQVLREARLEKVSRSLARDIRRECQTLAHGDSVARYSLSVCSSPEHFRKVWEVVRTSYPDYSPGQLFERESCGTGTRKNYIVDGSVVVSQPGAIVS